MSSFSKITSALSIVLTFSLSTCGAMYLLPMVVNISGWLLVGSAIAATGLFYGILARLMVL